jgi:ATP-dependent DNA helicase RecQ
MSNRLLWQLVYHLSGLTLLGRTEQEPLGSLPIPIRTAVLKTIDLQNPGTIELTLFKKSPLEFAEGEYEWVNSWHDQNSYLVDAIEESQDSSVFASSLLHQLPERYPTYQKVAFTLLWKAVQSGKSLLKIAEYQTNVAALALAVLDSLALIERVAELYGLPVELPEVELYLVGAVDELGVTQLLHHYRGAELGESANRVDCCHTSVRLMLATDLPIDLDFVSCARSLNNYIPENAYTFNELENFTSSFRAYVENVLPLHAHPVLFERPTLDYFARRYFLIPELKPAQVELIQKALRNESTVGILPTGFGKSLIFQLYALLIPRTTLVISPLQALIRDQVHNLNRPGLTCVDSIIYTDSNTARKTKLRNFKSGGYRLLYISPERLQIGEFYDEIKATMQQTPVGALVIDEAHCVSEWGHDFRPAYLQIGRLQQALEEASRRPVPIIALTATASEPVRKDILRVLGLTSNSVVQLASSDRPNLSLSVHSVSKPENKPEKLAYLLQTIVPQILGIPFAELIPENDKTRHAGIMFGIYANPHGKSTIHEGVHYIKDELTKRIIPNTNLVQVHASTQPEYCPECESPFFIRSDQMARCRSCQASFTASKSKKPQDWNSQLQRRQDAFQNNQFPLLVATKGYGMGIDKRNIRFIIHHAFASSLEAYYQEAGRAGRDGRHSHVALMYLPPHQECKDKHIYAGEIEPPCVSNGRNYIRHECPYYEDHLCDYGLQAHFIKDDYLGIKKDSERVISVYQKIISGEPIGFKNDKEDKNLQIPLYRLQQLGVVKEYSKHYSKGFSGGYKIEFDRNWSLDQIASNLKKFLVQTGTSENYAEGQLSRIDNTVFSPYHEKLLPQRRLTEALHILLERIYETVPRMRYQMLLNELDYATSDEEGTCRRVVIRGLFDSIEHLTTENYRCGFCDVCTPNLNFQGDKAAVPLQDAQVDEIAEKLPVLLEGFDTKALLEVLRLTIERGAVAGLFARVANRLERDSTSLAAFFLAGALARQRPGRETLAFDYLKRGFNEGIKQGLSPENLLLFYEEGVLLQPKEAFEWLTQVGGYWDSEEGLKFLIQEAAQRFGTDSTHYRVLIVRWLLGRFNEVGDDCAALKPRIEVIKNGFERLI